MIKSEREGLRIAEEDRRNIKLSIGDKERIRELYSSGRYSQRELAKIYRVSRRSIQFAINPKEYERAKELRKSRKYYDRDRHREYMSKYREHRRVLYAKGKLVKGE